MNKNTLIVFQTNYGFSEKVANFIADTIKHTNTKIDVCDVEDAAHMVFFTYQHIFIVTPIKYGSYSRSMLQFLKQFSHISPTHHVSVISIDLVSRKEGRNTLETNKQVKKMWDKIGWYPQSLTLIAGELNYNKYNFIEKRLMQMLMTIMKGPTSLTTSENYTDWEYLRRSVLNDLEK
ncbi:hypothetical protein K5X82_10755 [Halosquirtibacter xylanolyticus]|uniref:flavodoxin domain-containing protein n=1 Tax=Halosquirtibacter xylanolyticus TaxID=3374599 RepID=UPI0037489A51|nr:hypothetical protein K5X82_10755 [Prolixibacteraceae bacterium]